MENKTDVILKEIFKRMPQSIPSHDFTSQVMGRIDPGYEAFPEKVHTNFSFRAILAIGITLCFFIVLILTSDFAFTDTVIKMFSFLSSPRSTEPSLLTGLFEHAGQFSFPGKYVMVSVGLALAGGMLFMLDRYLGKKFRVPGMLSVI
jgi:hypothetical protein